LKNNIKTRVKHLRN